MKNEFIEFQEVTFFPDVTDNTRITYIKRDSIIRVSAAHKDEPELSLIYIDNGHPVMVKMTVKEVFNLL
jgi:hypothetical protein